MSPEQFPDQAGVACNSAYEAERLERIHSALKLHEEYVRSQYPDNIILATILIGSQNYHMDTKISDFDTISILAPTTENLVNGEMISHTYNNIPECNPKDQARVQDIRVFYRNLKKGAVNELETIYTNYYLINCDNGIFLQLRDKAKTYIQSNLAPFLEAYRGNLMGYVKKYHSAAVFDKKSFYHIYRIYSTVYNIIHNDKIDKTTFDFGESNPLRKTADFVLSQYKTICDQMVDELKEKVDSMVESFCPSDNDVLYPLVEKCLFLGSTKKGD